LEFVRLCARRNNRSKAAIGGEFGNTAGYSTHGYDNLAFLDNLLQVETLDGILSGRKIKCNVAFNQFDSSIDGMIKVGVDTAGTSVRLVSASEPKIA
jgi:hypothetical protein